jgi:hypothetical protein
MGQQAKIPLPQAIFNGFLRVTVKVLNSYEENKKAEFNVATKTQPLHGSNLFACVDAVLAVELIDTSAGSGCFLLACVE